MPSLASLIPFAVGAIFSAGGLVMLLRITGRDVNGLGRMVRKHIACDLRCVAVEIEDPIIRVKVLHIADLIDPK